MKKFLTLTLVLFLSLFMVGESGATLVKSKEIWKNGEVLSFSTKNQATEDWYDHVIWYRDNIYLCYVISKPLQGSPKAYCEEADIE